MKQSTARAASVLRPAILFALGGVAACGEGPTSSASATVLQPSAHPVTTVARLRGTVDVASGTLTFEPVSSTGASIPAGGVNAAIYGQQGATVTIYNSAVVTSAPVAGKKTYSANVGVRNMLGYRIGDEQNAAIPGDTLGIYVFTSTAPVVTGTSSPCSCAITVKNASGSRPFTTLAKQPYWYWPEFLGAKGGGADTTVARKAWVFEADTQVTGFSFDVLVSAAWSAPNEAVWKAEYSPDSLPDGLSKPHWRNFGTSKVAATIAGSNLQLDVQRAKDSVMYVRYDSISSGMDALMESTMQLVDGGNSLAPEAGIAMDDKTKYIGLFISDSTNTARARVGFIAPGGGFVAGGSDTVTVRTMRSYQMRKYGADSVVALVDGVRRFKVAYSALAGTRAAATGPSSVSFGIATASAKNTATTWSHVLYQIGQATP